MAQQQARFDELAVGMAELTALLLSTRDVEDSLRDLVNIASGMLPGRPMAGVTLRRDAGPMTVASTGAHAELIDEVQYSEGLGPCLEAIQTGAPVSVPDIVTERRWGRYPARMLTHGVRSIYSQPLVVEGTPIGALNLYSTRADGFDDRARDAIALTGAHTGVLLASAIAAARQADLTDQLRAALASRSVIDQALGMVMMQRQCTREAAFDVLRSTSQQRNIKLSAIAAEMIRTVTGFDPSPPHFRFAGDGR
ncbi:GAF and ANTAR domain-containing protein [Nocardia pseudobrasiliensis]|uniref:GAF domain-containing protein n=1 Tax=Nocardia pseudobrasiliensis TaxID=45979 RepID=A0A370IBH7_9NOCA|nr:GAF and ANTAR domain-containing protein [Nocardia pseudobrasiliensis]RDI68086.1 GAF domain-containing protein [Nocardia pseudobrasiliensis]